MSGGTEIGGGFFVQGSADTAEEIAPEPVDGFPSAWHKQRYIDDLRRNVATKSFDSRMPA